MSSILVLLGRFQVAELSNGQRSVLLDAQEKYAKVVVLVRETPVPCTKRNPFDGATRRLMIQEAYPQMEVHVVPDLPDPQTWSEALDARFSSFGSPESVVVAAEPDEAFEAYTGAFHIQQIPALSVAEMPEPTEAMQQSAAFRYGMLHALKRRYPTAFATVDVAIFKDDHILLGQKPHEKAWRFLGGFVDPTDENHEAAAIREAHEESGVTVAIEARIGSHKIDDWRYRNEEDKIISTLFKARYVSGDAHPTDDIARLQWLPFETLNINDFVPDHQPLFNMLKAFMD
jgi:bifunctional NMN adenylyltransferase/nudix hydrolase